jgi:hypothetical protein
LIKEDKALPEHMGCMWDFVINAALFRWPVVIDLSANLFQRVLFVIHSTVIITTTQ